MANIKKEAINLITDMKDDADWDDIMYSIYIKQKIASGIESYKKGETISHEEVKKRVLNNGNNLD